MPLALHWVGWSCVHSPGLLGPPRTRSLKRLVYWPGKYRNANVSRNTLGVSALIHTYTTKPMYRYTWHLLYYATPSFRVAVAGSLLGLVGSNDYGACLLHCTYASSMLWKSQSITFGVLNMQHHAPRYRWRRGVLGTQNAWFHPNDVWVQKSSHWAANPSLPRSLSG